MTALDLDAIKARAEAATPGPWHNACELAAFHPPTTTIRGAPIQSQQEDPVARINTRDIIDDLEVAISRLEVLDGMQMLDPGRTSSDNAAITRELLYIEHVLDKARVGVMEEYHQYKASAADRPASNKQGRR